MKNVKIVLGLVLATIFSGSHLLGMTAAQTLEAAANSAKAAVTKAGTDVASAADDAAIVKAFTDLKATIDGITLPPQKGGKGTGAPIAKVPKALKILESVQEALPGVRLAAIKKADKPTDAALSGAIKAVKVSFNNLFDRLGGDPATLAKLAGTWKQAGVFAKSVQKEEKVVTDTIAVMEAVETAKGGDAAAEKAAGDTLADMEVASPEEKAVQAAFMDLFVDKAKAAAAGISSTVMGAIGAAYSTASAALGGTPSTGATTVVEAGVKKVLDKMIPVLQKQLERLVNGGDCQNAWASAAIANAELKDVRNFLEAMVNADVPAMQAIDDFWKAGIGADATKFTTAIIASAKDVAGAKALKAEINKLKAQIDKVDTALKAIPAVPPVGPVPVVAVENLNTDLGAIQYNGAKAFKALVDGATTTAQVTANLNAYLKPAVQTALDAYAQAVIDMNAAPNQPAADLQWANIKLVNDFITAVQGKNGTIADALANRATKTAGNVAGLTTAKKIVPVVVVAGEKLNTDLGAIKYKGANAFKGLVDGTTKTTDVTAALNTYLEGTAKTALDAYAQAVTDMNAAPDQSAADVQWANIKLVNDFITAVQGKNGTIADALANRATKTAGNVAGLTTAKKIVPVVVVAGEKLNTDLGAIQYNGANAFIGLVDGTTKTTDVTAAPNNYLVKAAKDALADYAQAVTDMNAAPDQATADVEWNKIKLVHDFIKSIPAKNVAIADALANVATGTTKNVAGLTATQKIFAIKTATGAPWAMPVTTLAAGTALSLKAVTELNKTGSFTGLVGGTTSANDIIDGLIHPAKTQYITSPIVDQIRNYWNAKKGTAAEHATNIQPVNDFILAVLAHDGRQGVKGLADALASVALGDAAFGKTTADLYPAPTVTAGPNTAAYDLALKNLTDYINNLATAFPNLKAKVLTQIGTATTNKVIVAAKAAVGVAGAGQGVYDTQKGKLEAELAAVTALANDSSNYKKLSTGLGTGTSAGTGILGKKAHVALDGIKWNPGTGVTDSFLNITAKTKLADVSNLSKHHLDPALEALFKSYDADKIGANFDTTAKLVNDFILAVKNLETPAGNIPVGLADALANAASAGMTAGTLATKPAGGAGGGGGGAPDWATLVKPALESFQLNVDSKKIKLFDASKLVEKPVADIVKSSGNFTLEWIGQIGTNGKIDEYVKNCAYVSDRKDDYQKKPNVGKGKQAKTRFDDAVRPVNKLVDDIKSKKNDLGEDNMNALLLYLYTQMKLDVSTGLVSAEVDLKAKQDSVAFVK